MVQREIDKRKGNVVVRIRFQRLQTFEHYATVSKEDWETVKGSRNEARLKKICQGVTMSTDSVTDELIEIEMVNTRASDLSDGFIHPGITVKE